MFFKTIKKLRAHEKFGLDELFGLGLVASLPDGVNQFLDKVNEESPEYIQKAYNWYKALPDTDDDWEGYKIHKAGIYLDGHENAAERRANSYRIFKDILTKNSFENYAV